MRVYSQNVYEFRPIRVHELNEGEPILSDDTARES
jgi:hypothetical protein